MSLVEELLQLDNPDTRRTFLIHNLHLVAAAEQGDISSEFSFQVKSKANFLLQTDQRQKGLDLAESLLYLSVLLPENNKRERNLSRARALMVRANYLRDDGDYARAALNYQQAQDLCLKNHSQIEAIRCQMALAHTLGQLNRYDEAFALAEETIQQAEATGNHSLLGDVLNNVATLYSDNNDYQKALELFSWQHQILQEIGDEGKSALLFCYIGLANNLLYLNRYDEAISKATEAKILAQELGQQLSLAHAEQIIGNAQYFLGQFTKALRTWDNTLILFQGANIPRQTHWVNQWRCVCLMHLNRLEEALVLCKLMIDEAQANEWLEYLAMASYFQAATQSRLEFYDIALVSYEAAALLFEKAKKFHWTAHVHLNWAELLVKIGAYSEAQQLLDKAEEVFIRQEMPKWLAQIWLLQAQIAQAEGSLDKAELLIRQASGFIRTYNIPSLNYQVNSLLGEIAEKRGQPDKALDHYCEAITQVEQMRGSVTLELRGDFLKDKMQVYEAAVFTALNQADIERAYDYIERSKSRALTELLANQVDLQVRPRNPADEPLIEQLNKLRAEHNRLYTILNQSLEFTPNLRGASLAILNPEMTETQSELHKLEKQIEQILMQLQIRNAAYAEDSSLIEVTSESPQPWLDQDTLLVEYYIARDEVLALAISATEKRVFRNLIPAGKLARSIDTLSLSLQNMKPHLAGKFLGATQAQLNNLYKALVGPIAEFATGFRHLIFVAHGPLHYLPFHALWNSNTGRYLVEDFEVSYLPAASQIKFYRQRSEELRHETKPKQSLIMGYSSNNNLPFVVQEAEEIAALLHEKPYLENEVKRGIMEQVGETYRVIHLASHGHFRADAPLFSFVELADGRLLTTDVFNMKLNANLVTLSACESGLNVITGGDELLGLSRACLYAGAASLLLSLWRVEDQSTTCLMKEFYKALNQPGVTRAAALRQAQLALLRGELAPEQPETYRHPYFWAPFFLIGEYGELT